MFLEVIAINLTDIKTINQTKASQIELCSAMDQGGYTPDYDLIKKACAVSKIPVRVMVRHSNAGFNISAAEFQQWQTDIAFIKTTKAAGIVCGILTKDHEIDLERMQVLIKLAHPLKVTFHRAFDEIPNHQLGLQQLIDLGVDTVLTSGGTNVITSNIDEIVQLENLHWPIRILLGGGINLENLKLFTTNNLTNLHVGKCVRDDDSFQKPINKSLIKQVLTSK